MIFKEMLSNSTLNSTIFSWAGSLQTAQSTHILAMIPLRYCRMSQMAMELLNVTKRYYKQSSFGVETADTCLLKAWT